MVDTILATIYNDSNSEEFLYWKPMLAIDILIHCIALPFVTLFWTITVFVTLIKTKLGNKPLTVLYCSFLLVLILDKIVASITTIIISPDMFRYCICNDFAIAFLAVYGSFSNTYSVVIISCQSLLQLKIIQGKKQWKKYNRIIPCIGVSFLIAIYLVYADTTSTNLFTVITKYLRTFVCTKFYSFI